jgi:hypothetical protein
MMISALVVMPGIRRKIRRDVMQRERPERDPGPKERRARVGLLGRRGRVLVRLERILGDHADGAGDGAVPLKRQCFELDPHRIAGPQPHDVGAVDVDLGLQLGSARHQGEQRLGFLGDRADGALGELQDHAVGGRTQHHEAAAAPSA